MEFMISGTPRGHLTAGDWYLIVYTVVISLRAMLLMIYTIPRRTHLNLQGFH